MVIDQDSGEILTYVSSVKVTVGDEYISDDFKRYVVTKIEENRAYAQSFGPVDEKRTVPEDSNKNKLLKGE
ncbi:MAG TPA: hypothetical protein PKA28_19020 [Methylomusa anaerophila]|uniref:Uncharacterized protein n=1 Tax=Methylomusa anaerophila TaxID=1930071 RepID=A0A348AIB9_9FIRM|nr:hypothetical protein [Methylomusa anaerophila]BBB90817.1 hypothetical protein MAMMFC1_01478 [Methylomusa anaerophila]HML90526.1 hypothetical protein [Methylomusa anaerophila]